MIITNTKDEASALVAKRIATLIKEKQQRGEQAVLGLATGSTPKGVYKELVRMHKEEGLSFANVVTFNLDEYFPMLPTDVQSYVYFMKQQLFDHIDIPTENINIPDGAIAAADIAAFCAGYEQRIEAAGGLDFQLLGIGRTGHIGFNEPGSTEDSTTRLVELNAITREDGIGDFGTLEAVPTQAITMGVQTITKAKDIVIMALGARKADIMHATLHGAISSEVPASFLRNYEHVTYVMDKEAVKE